MAREEGPVDDKGRHCNLVTSRSMPGAAAEEARKDFLPEPSKERGPADILIRLLDSPTMRE